MNRKSEWKQYLQKWKKTGYTKNQLLILLLAGILLLVIAIPSAPKKKAGGRESERKIQTASGEDYAEMMERKLERILCKIEGAGEVSVMITLKSTAEKVVEKDAERTSETIREGDSQGGSRETTNSQSAESTVYQKADGAENPYISKELSPAVEGVIVIAKGGGNAVVRKNITEAVQALFGIDTHKIKVMKQNS